MVKYLEDWETSDVRSKQAKFSDSDWLTTENCELATVSVSCSWYDWYAGIVFADVLLFCTIF